MSVAVRAVAPRAHYFPVHAPAATDPASAAQLLVSLCNLRASADSVADVAAALQLGDDTLPAVLAYLAGLHKQASDMRANPSALHIIADRVRQSLSSRHVRPVVPVLNASLLSLLARAVKGLDAANAHEAALSLLLSCPRALASAELFDGFVLRLLVRMQVQLPWMQGTASAVTSASFPLRAANPSAEAALRVASECIVAAAGHGLIVAPAVLRRYSEVCTAVAPAALLSTWDHLLSVLSQARSPRALSMVTAAVQPYLLACSVAVGDYRSGLQHLAAVKALSARVASSSGPALARQPPVPLLTVASASPRFMRPPALLCQSSPVSCVVWACLSASKPVPHIAYEYCSAVLKHVEVYEDDAPMLALLIATLSRCGDAHAAVQLLSALGGSRRLGHLDGMLVHQPKAALTFAKRAANAEVFELEPPESPPAAALGVSQDVVHLGQLVLRCAVASSMHKGWSSEAVVQLLNTVGLHHMPELILWLVQERAPAYRTVSLVSRLLALGVPIDDAVVTALARQCFAGKKLLDLGLLAEALWAHWGGARVQTLAHVWFAASFQVGPSAGYTPGAGLVRRLVDAGTVLQKARAPLSVPTLHLLLDATVRCGIRSSACMLWELLGKTASSAHAPVSHAQCRQMVRMLCDERRPQYEEPGPRRVEMLLRVTLDVLKRYKLPLSQEEFARVLASVRAAEGEMGVWWVTNATQHLQAQYQSTTAQLVKGE